MVFTRSEVKNEFKYYLPEVFKAKDPKMYALITVSIYQVYIKFQGVQISGPFGYSKRKVRPNDRENLTTISTIGHDERVQTAHQTTEWKIHWQEDLRFGAKCDLIVLFLNQLQQNVI